MAKLRIIPVFDRGQVHSLSPDPGNRMGLISGLGGGDVGGFLFRRDDRDRRPVRSVVTAQVLGDPPPEREFWRR